MFPDDIIGDILEYTSLEPVHNTVSQSFNQMYLSRRRIDLYIQNRYPTWNSQDIDSIRYNINYMALLDQWNIIRYMLLIYSNENVSNTVSEIAYIFNRDDLSPDKRIPSYEYITRDMIQSLDEYRTISLDENSNPILIQLYPDRYNHTLGSISLTRCIRTHDQIRESLDQMEYTHGSPLLIQFYLNRLALQDNWILYMDISNRYLHDEKIQYIARDIASIFDRYDLFTDDNEYIPIGMYTSYIPHRIPLYNEYVHREDIEFYEDNMCLLGLETNRILNELYPYNVSRIGALTYPSTIDGYPAYDDIAQLREIDTIIGRSYRSRLYL